MQIVQMQILPLPLNMNECSFSEQNLHLLFMNYYS